MLTANYDTFTSGTRITFKLSLGYGDPSSPSSSIRCTFPLLNHSILIAKSLEAWHRIVSIFQIIPLPLSFPQSHDQISLIRLGLKCNYESSPVFGDVARCDAD